MSRASYFMVPEKVDKTMSLSHQKYPIRCDLF